MTTPTPPAASPFAPRRAWHATAALGGALVGLAAFLLSLTGAGNVLELQSLDARFRRRPSRPVDSGLAIVFIGDDSVRGLGRWPWPWDTHALLVDALKRHGARAVIFDVLFAEQPDAAGTEFFPQTARAAGNVTFSSYFGALEHNPAAGFPPIGSNLVEPVPSLREVARGVGHSNAEPDEDGITRRVPLVVLHKGRHYPSTALLAALERLGVPFSEVALEPGVSLNVPLPGAGGTLRIPIDRQGLCRVNFTGGLGSFEQYSYLQVLQADQAPAAAVVDLERFRGKTVLVGATFAGSTAIRPTPLDKAFPLLCVTGNVVDNILRREFVRRPAPAWRLLGILALGAVTGLVFSSLRPMPSLTAAALAAAGLVALGVQRFEAAGVWLDIVAPVGVVLVNYLAVTTGLYVVHRRVNRENVEYLKYMNDLVESSHEGIVSINAAGEIATWNTGAGAIFGKAERRAAGAARPGEERRRRKPPSLGGGLAPGVPVSTGVGWERLVSPAGRGQVLQALREVAATREPRTLETVGMREDGSPFPLGMTLSTIADSEGRAVGVSCILMDLTEKKRIMEILVQSEKLAEIGRLGSGIVHEIKNPLTSIMMLSATALERRTLDEPAARKFFAIIDQEAQRILNLTMNVLTFARPKQAEMKPVDLNALVEGTLALVEYELKKKQVTLDKRLAEGGVEALGDAEKLKQVFLNLIINAVHAMDRGGRLEIATGFTEGPADPPGDWHTVLVGAAPGGRAATVSFRDHGCGIPPAIMEKIFEPFFSTKAEGEGTGLGLYITRTIVLEHKGSLTLSSREGEGTQFLIALPPSPAP